MSNDDIVGRYYLNRYNSELHNSSQSLQFVLWYCFSRHQNSQWTDWLNEWGSRLDRMNDSDFKFNDKKTFLKTIVDKIIVKSKDKLQHELSIKFKFPYVNDELIYNDINDKSKGYILKDGSYSKKLRVSSLKKN
jgi:hypothetical protein